MKIEKRPVRAKEVAEATFSYRKAALAATFGNELYDINLKPSEVL